MKKVIFTAFAATLLAVSLPADQKIHDRRENQQDRIGQGVTSGQLTAGETSRVEKQESNVNKEIRADRNANGGKLTNGEKRLVNRQQNKMSREIYRDKHNKRVQ
jgi:hypothetical protein